MEKVGTSEDVSAKGLLLDLKEQARAAVLSLNYAGGFPQTVSLSGNGVQGTSGVSFSPSTLPAFASQKVQNASPAQTITLTNTGTNPITGVSVSLSGANTADFSQTTTCGATVSAAGNCTTSVTFKPLAIGIRVATITIAYTSSGGQQTVSFNLSGTGQ